MKRQEKLSTVYIIGLVRRSRYWWTGGIGEPNIMYGALYGMNARLPNGPGLQVIESIWHLWDALDIAEYDM